MFKSSTSLRARLFLTVVVGLIAIVGVHLALSAWLVRSVYMGERARLLGWATSYAQVFGSSSDGQALASASPPDVKFQQERSGTWAVLLSAGSVAWSSSSTPVLSRRAPLVGFDFNEKQPTWFHPPGRGTFAFSQDPKIPHRLVLSVFASPGETDLNSAVDVASNESKTVLVLASDSTESIERLNYLRSALWLGMFLSLVAILAAQVIAARWTAAPLTRLVSELRAVRAGSRSRLGIQYPREVDGVVSGFNELLDREALQLLSHRNALDNLAHSLKTPLAVLRSVAENESDPVVLRQAVESQVSRMDQQVAYHLASAGRQGRAWRPPVEPQALEPIAMNLAQGLEKLYAEKGAICEFDGVEDFFLAMEKGDIQEMFGNLLDNAFKWCKSRVLLSSRQYGDRIVIEVGDDGPGVPVDRVDDIRHRGRRADERTPGHGIGLAAVDDILSLYGGTLEVDRHPDLGGARFHVVLSASRPQ